MFNSHTQNEAICHEIANKLICYMNGDDCQMKTDGHKLAEELLDKNPAFLMMVKDKVIEIFSQKVNQLCDQHEVH